MESYVSGGTASEIKIEFETSEDVCLLDNNMLNINPYSEKSIPTNSNFASLPQDNIYTKNINSTLKEEEPTPTEDLMKEHGILNRIMLIYENVLFKIDSNIHFDLQLVFDSATIVKEFIEEYHEPMEEKYIFAFLLERNLHVELISELIKQHRLSKIITGKIFKYINLTDLEKLSKYIKLFLYMYRAHESREDTIIFNQFRKIAGAELIKEIGEKFEESEHELFGVDGYGRLLDQVIKIEIKLNIYNLAIYTPIII